MTLESGVEASWQKFVGAWTKLVIGGSARNEGAVKSSGRREAVHGQKE